MTIPTETSRRLETKVWKDLPLEDRSIRSAPTPTLSSVSYNIDDTRSLVAGNFIKFIDVMGKVPRVIPPVCVIVLLLPANVFKTPQSCKQNRTIMFNICFALEQFDVFWGRCGASFLRKHRQLLKHEFQAFLWGYQHLSCRVRKFSDTKLIWIRLVSPSVQQRSDKMRFWQTFFKVEIYCIRRKMFLL